MAQLHLFPNDTPAIPTSRTTFDALTEAFAFDPGDGWVDRFGASLHRWATTNVKRRIRTLSLFSGAGGLDIGFHDAGFDILTMVEIESKFAATLRANLGEGRYFGEAQVECVDIREYRPAPLKIDFIIGGPPCQTFSAAGRRAAGVRGTSDERGALFEEYVRLLKALTPEGFLFENVYGITGAENGEAWERIRAAFSDAGYEIFFRILDAADYGVPQHRERLFIVGRRLGSYRFPRPTHGPDSPGKQPYFTAAEAIQGATVSDEDMPSSIGGRYGYLLPGIPPGLNHSFYTEKMGHPQPMFAWRSKFSDFLYKADPTTPVRTIKAQGGQYTGPFHWANRPFSITELKRLQTFPDDYQIEGGKQISIHQIGNSVPPQLARILALSILHQVFGVDLPVNLPLLENHQILGFRKRKSSLTSIYQGKARTAIRGLSVHKPMKRVNRSRYHARLADDFDWIVSPKRHSDASMSVSCTFSEKAWDIHAMESSSIGKPAFIITVAPLIAGGWGLNTEQVLLKGTNLSRECFTGVWKAFERELCRLEIKADLVQLCGYYQYPPNLRCSIQIEEAEGDQKWRVVSAIVSGIGTRAIISTDDLADIWGVPVAAVMENAQFLRHLGYEVRNENTNPQIPKGAFLIPYTFPTLTPLSVQLHKHLEISHDR